MRLTIFTVLLTGLAAIALVLSTHAATSAGIDSCRDLANARSFSFARTVRTGRVISAEKAFGAVLKRSNTLGCLRTVLKSGSIEGKMYALVALRELDRNECRRQIANLGQQSFKVITLMTQENGTMEVSAGKTVLDRIERGDFKPFFQFYRTGSFRW